MSQCSLTYGLSLNYPLFRSCSLSTQSKRATRVLSPNIHPKYLLHAIWWPFLTFVHTDRALQISYQLRVASNAFFSSVVSPHYLVLHPYKLTASPGYILFSTATNPWWQSSVQAWLVASLGSYRSSLHILLHWLPLIVAFCSQYSLRDTLPLASTSAPHPCCFTITGSPVILLGALSSFPLPFPSSHIYKPVSVRFAS